MLSDDRVDVYRTGDFARVASFEAPGASNLVSVLGGGLLAVGDQGLWRLSPRAAHPKAFPRLTGHVGNTQLLPHPRHAEDFTLYRRGETELPDFDLGREAGEVLPAAGTHALPDFDQRALVGLRDGGFAYTVAGGLATLSHRGERRVLGLSELGAVWGLARASRLDRLWAVDDDQAYLVALRGEPRIISRLELPPGGVALDNAGSRLALLSVERAGPEGMRLRVDVWDRDPERHRVLRFSDAAAGASSGTFQPELSLSPGRELVATRAFTTQVFDWRRGVRIFSSSDRDGATLAVQAP